MKNSGTESILVAKWNGFDKGLVAAVLLLVTLTAAYLPTRRAMHVDPMVALRYE